jgi:hypothetical protein
MDNAAKVDSTSNSANKKEAAFESKSKLSNHKNQVDSAIPGDDIDKINEELNSKEEELKKIIALIEDKEYYHY